MQIQTFKEWTDPSRQHQRATHDNHRQQSKDGIIIVVGGGIPSVVHPSPPDRKKGEPKRTIPLLRVLGYRVMQADRSGCDGNYRDEIEQQFERSGRARCFRWIAGTDHLHKAVSHKITPKIRFYSNRTYLVV